jgi:hypothetical protein
MFMNTMLRTAREQKLLTDHPVLLIDSYKGPGKKHQVFDVFSIQEIQYRAETMTPVLKAILDFRPRPHWG